MESEVNYGIIKMPKKRNCFRIITFHMQSRAFLQNPVQPLLSCIPPLNPSDHGKIDRTLDQIKLGYLKKWVNCDFYGLGSARSVLNIVKCIILISTIF